jgi:hypothetical protein
MIISHHLKKIYRHSGESRNPEVLTNSYREFGTCYLLYKVGEIS